MSTEALAAPANDPVVVSGQDQIDSPKLLQLAFLHSPPDSNDTHKTDASDSELSDLDEEPVLSDAPMPAPESDDVNDEDDIGEVLPDHWSGSVPVFKPTMHQFKDFKRFQIKVREPIKQDIMGSNGTYRQVNILHGRSYNLPQWRQLCEQSEHQPPARRGERRANAEKPKPRATRSRAAAASNSADNATPKKRGKGRPAKGKGKGRGKSKRNQEEEEEDRPMTPVSPKPEVNEKEDKPVESIEKDPGVNVNQTESAPTVGRMGGSRQAKPTTQSVSARRKYSRREGSAMIDEAAFKDWDYRMDVSEYTPERCEELERAYWKTLTYAPPLYGADLMGTLFPEEADTWNLNKLPNLLDVLGTKVPGVNTAYLYLGMWKATFAWHLEDVDLYSINYLHFGAPKQWYSISQADARRFEAAMKSIWPTDAKACDQFLRHKAFLISPQHLLQHYGIKVNKCVSYPGEFVVTYPYGYHSGYNLGYNCAEAVNFALDSWLDMGKIAKKCECAQAQDSVWVNVYEIERKLRGEETEYEETEEEEEEDDDELSGLPTPPASHGVKFKDASRKRKRGTGEKGGKLKVKKIKLRINLKAEPPCCLCPNDIAGIELLPTDDGRKAHRLCALYLPETYIDTVDDKEVVSNAARIHKDRLNLKCLYCRSKRGACFQCSQNKCTRSYHATCAAAAGVFIEEEDVPVYGEDGTEYKEQAFEFSCRFHRTKRDRKLDGDALEADSQIRAAAAALKKGETCQLQYHKGEIFAGRVIENRNDEQTLVLEILPNGDRLEVEWKWLLLPDPADCHLPKASANALPMPTSRKAKDELNAKRHEDEKPRKDDAFLEGYTWAEFSQHDACNKDQVKVDLCKEDQLWYYLGKNSTEARAQYTEDLSKPRHNPRGNYLDTIPKAPKPVPNFKIQQQRAHATAAAYARPYSTTNTMAMTSASVRPEKPYTYKPRKPVDSRVGIQGMVTAQRFTHASSPLPQNPQPSYSQYSNTPSQGYQNPPMYSTYSAQRYEVKTPQSYVPRQTLSSISHSGNTESRPVQHQWLPQAPTPRPMQNQHHVPTPVSYQGPMPAQPRPQAKPSWQVHSSIYQRYEFFQVNHNRDSKTYRTPYSPLGGFTNGYEGNLRAHLMANKDDLLRSSSLMFSPPQPSQASYGSAPMGSYQSTYGRAPGGVSQIPATSHASPYRPATTNQPQAASWTPSGSRSASHQHLPPAIKAQYLPKGQQPRLPAKALLPESKAKPVSANKSYKLGEPALVQQRASTKQTFQIPPKESPVPLPANFLAAMTSSTNTPASSPKPSIQSSGNDSPSVKAQSTASTPPVTQALQAVTTPAKPGSLPKISTTPVPIPKLPGMAQKHLAAQSITPQPRQALSSTQMPGIKAEPLGLSPPSQMQAAQAQQAVSTATSQPSTGLPAGYGPQEFADVPGGESMEFVERLMNNLRKVSQRDDAA
ncbi:Fc.00g007970.m01.CDS01 [Cosmosporella sp. VM-42]